MRFDVTRSRRLVAPAILFAAAAPPLGAQENCSSPVVIPGPLPFSVSSDTTGAVDDYDPGPFRCTFASADGPDHVYSYTPAADQVVDLTLTPGAPSYDASLWVFTDCLSPDTSCVAGADRYGAGPAERIELLALTGGITYFVAVDGFDDPLPTSEPFGPYTLDLVPAVVPDGCATARPVARLPSIERLDTSVGADDLDPAPACGLASQTGADLVYLLEPPFPAAVTVRMEPDGGYNGSVYALSDCSLPASSCVAGSDTGAAGSAESIDLSLVPGSPLWVVVDGPFGAGGYEIRFLAAEDCASPIVVDTLPFLTEGDTSGSADDFDLASFACTGFFTRSYDVVYELAFPSDAYFVVGAEPLDPGFDVSLYALGDCAAPDATCVAGSDQGDDGAPEALPPLFLAAGSTVFVALDSFIPFEGGPYRLAVDSAPDVRLLALRRGADVELRFAGAAPPYELTRDVAPDFSALPVVLSTAAASPFTDAPGAADVFYKVE